MGRIFRAVEIALLFNSYRDDATDHFEFDAEGNIRPRRLTRGVSRMGKTSIAELGLQRAGLVDARRTHADMILATIHRIEELARELEERNSRRPEQLLREELSQHKSSLRPDHPCGEVARQLIDPFLREMAARTRSSRRSATAPRWVR